MAEWIDILKIGIPTVISFFAGRFVEAQKAVQTDLTQRVDEFCKLTQDTMDAASQYWSVGAEADAAKDRITSLKLVANLHQLGRIQIYCGKLLAEFNHGNSRELLDDFHDDVSGGDFQSVNRAADPIRAARILDTGNRLIMGARENRRALLLSIKRILGLPKR